MTTKERRGAILFPLLFVFRLFNAILIRTHFEPDEYFQSVEVSLNSMLGRKTFTWEWYFGIRPVFFVGIFYVPLRAAKFALDRLEMLTTSFSSRGVSLAPYEPGILFMRAVPYVVKLVCALFAAANDYCTVQMYRRINEIEDALPSEILTATVMNIGLWLYSTRSHINSFEMSMCTLVSYLLVLCSGCKDKREKKRILLAASFLTGVTLYNRTTSLFVLLPVWLYALYHEVQRYNVAWKIAERKKDRKVGGYYALYCRHTRVLGGGNFLSGFLALALCTACDSLYYGEFTVVPYEFYKINMRHKISHIFGTPPAYVAGLFFCVLIGAYTAMVLVSRSDWRRIEFAVPAVYILAHSAIAHKEMRFLLPAVPFVNMIVAQNLKTVKTDFSTGFFAFLKRQIFSKKVFAINLLVGVFLGIDHQNITRPLSYLRSECITHLRTKNNPVFVLSVFKPYMLPYNTYLGHKRVVVREIHNNPDLTPLLPLLRRKEKFRSSQYELVALEHYFFSSRMTSNLIRSGVEDYTYLVIDSKYDHKVERRIPGFVKVHESSHLRFPAVQRVSIYKRADIVK